MLRLGWKRAPRRPFIPPRLLESRVLTRGTVCEGLTHQRVTIIPINIHAIAQRSFSSNEDLKKTLQDMKKKLEKPDLTNDSTESTKTSQSSASSSASSETNADSSSAEKSDKNEPNANPQISAPSINLVEIMSHTVNFAKKGIQFTIENVQLAYQELMSPGNAERHKYHPASESYSLILNGTELYRKRKSIENKSCTSRVNEKTQKRF